MATLKRTYVLPQETLAEFEQIAASGERSAVIAQALQEWLDNRRREQLRRQIREGCRDMAEIYRQIEREYHSLEEEAHRALDTRPQTRRRRARSARSRRRV